MVSQNSKTTNLYRVEQYAGLKSGWLPITTVSALSEAIATRHHYAKAQPTESYRFRPLDGSTGYNYLGSSQDLPPGSITAMMKKSISVGYPEFEVAVGFTNLREFLQRFGYYNGRTLQPQCRWAIEFRQSKHKGQKVYVMTHDSIAYVFAIAKFDNL